jgi:hypothetical protein
LLLVSIFWQLGCKPATTQVCSMSCLIEPNSTSFVQPVESMERLLFLLELWNFHGFITSQLGGINRS